MNCNAENDTYAFAGLNTRLVLRAGGACKSRTRPSMRLQVGPQIGSNAHEFGLMSAHNDERANKLLGLAAASGPWGMMVMLGSKAF